MICALDDFNDPSHAANPNRNHHFLMLFLCDRISKWLSWNANLLVSLLPMTTPMMMWYQWCFVCCRLMPKVCFTVVHNFIIKVSMIRLSTNGNGIKGQHTNMSLENYFQFLWRMKLLRAWMKTLFSVSVCSFSVFIVRIHCLLFVALLRLLPHNCLIVFTIFYSMRHVHQFCLALASFFCVQY